MTLCMGVKNEITDIRIIKTCRINTEEYEVV